MSAVAPLRTYVLEGGTLLIPGGESPDRFITMLLPNGGPPSRVAKILRHVADTLEHIEREHLKGTAMAEELPR